MLNCKDALDYSEKSYCNRHYEHKNGYDRLIGERQQAHCCQLAAVLSASCCGPMLRVMLDHQLVRRCSTSGLP